MFLHEYLKWVPADARVLVLERGARESHAWQMEHRGDFEKRHEGQFVNRNPDKPWVFRLAFGGASNCWFACVPRMLPEDFELQTRYGVAVDWPLGYDDLEEYYCLAEELMAVAGPSGDTPFARSRPYPQPEHRLSSADEVLKTAYPDRFFVQPTARPRQTTTDGRLGCCANGVCRLCPIDSKFTIANGMAGVYEDPRVELLLSARVDALEVAGGQVQGVRYTLDDAEMTARGDLVALGANGLFNPHLLLRSGLDGPAVGRGLCEQVSVRAIVDFDGLDNLQGSTIITGHGYMLYPGEHRRHRAAGLMETFNHMRLRDVRGRWLQRMELKVIFEDLRQERNRVRLSGKDAERPQAHFEGRSAYAEAAIEKVEASLEEVLSPLPVERIDVKSPPNSTEAHILGTAVMGRDPETSVVDENLLHHRARNLFVLGGSAFPTAAPANPTLTICALSLRSAREIFAS